MPNYFGDSKHYLDQLHGVASGGHRSRGRGGGASKKDMPPRNSSSVDRTAGFDPPLAGPRKEGPGPSTSLLKRPPPKPIATPGPNRGGGLYGARRDTLSGAQTPGQGAFQQQSHPAPYLALPTPTRGVNPNQLQANGNGFEPKTNQHHFGRAPRQRSPPRRYSDGPDPIDSLANHDYPAHHPPPAKRPRTDHQPQHRNASNTSSRPSTARASAAADSNSQRKTKGPVEVISSDEDAPQPPRRRSGSGWSAPDAEDPILPFEDEDVPGPSSRAAKGRASASSTEGERVASKHFQPGHVNRLAACFESSSEPSQAGSSSRAGQAFAAFDEKAPSTRARAGITGRMKGSDAVSRSGKKDSQNGGEQEKRPFPIFDPHAGMGDSMKQARSGLGAGASIEVPLLTWYWGTREMHIRNKSWVLQMEKEVLSVAMEGGPDKHSVPLKDIVAMKLSKDFEQHPFVAVALDSASTTAKHFKKGYCDPQYSQLVFVPDVGSGDYKPEGYETLYDRLKNTKYRTKFEYLDAPAVKVNIVAAQESYRSFVELASKFDDERHAPSGPSTRSRAPVPVIPGQGRRSVPTPQQPPSSLPAPRPSRPKPRPSTGAKARGASYEVDDDSDVEEVKPPQATRRQPSRQSKVHQEISPCAPSPDPGEVLLVFSEAKGAINLTYGDRKRLEEGEFLNDTLIEFGLKLWYSKLVKENPAVAEQIHFFNSFFYKKLTQKPTAEEKKRGIERNPYENVRKWTNKFNLFDKKYIVVPINEHYHWFLAIIINPRYGLEPPPPGSERPPLPPKRTRGGTKRAAQQPSDENKDMSSSASRPAKKNKGKGKALPTPHKPKQTEVVEISDDEDEEEEESGNEDVRPPDAADQPEASSTTVARPPSASADKTPRPSEAPSPPPPPAAAPSLDKAASVEPPTLPSPLPPATTAASAADPQEVPATPSSENGDIDLLPSHPRGAQDEDVEMSDAASQLRMDEDRMVGSGAEATGANAMDVDQADASPAEAQQPAAAGADADADAEMRDGSEGTEGSVSEKASDKHPAPDIYTFDSLGNTHKPIIRALKDYLKYEALDKKRVPENTPMNGMTEANGHTAQVPIQPNFCDCGVYILHFVERFFSDPEGFLKLMSSRGVSREVINARWDRATAEKRRKALADEVDELSKKWMEEQEMAMREAEAKKKAKAERAVAGKAATSTSKQPTPAGDASATPSKESSPDPAAKASSTSTHPPPAAADRPEPPAAALPANDVPSETNRDKPPTTHPTGDSAPQADRLRRSGMLPGPAEQAAAGSRDATPHGRLPANDDKPVSARPEAEVGPYFRELQEHQSVRDRDPLVDQQLSLLKSGAKHKAAHEEYKGFEQSRNAAARRFDRPPRAESEGRRSTNSPDSSGEGMEHPLPGSWIDGATSRAASPAPPPTPAAAMHSVPSGTGIPFEYTQASPKAHAEANADEQPGRASAADGAAASGSRASTPSCSTATATAATSTFVSPRTRAKARQEEQNKAESERKEGSKSTKKAQGAREGSSNEVVELSSGSEDDGELEPGPAHTLRKEGSPDF